MPVELPDFYFSATTPPQTADRRWGAAAGPLQAQLDGFDLHAARCVLAQHLDARPRLEALLRYWARPPISEERLRLARSVGAAAAQARRALPWRAGGERRSLVENVNFG